MATSLDALQKKADTLQGQLSQSDTASTRNVLPTSRDMTLSSQYEATKKAINDLQSTQIRNQWYGKNETPLEDSSKTSGLIPSVLRGLTKPLSAVVGTAEYGLGLGTEPSLIQNINKSMEVGKMSGDVLAKLGAPKPVQVVGGFALDLALDPINWATLGTEALIPRIGYGAYKGAAEEGITGALRGIKTGLASNLERKAAKVMDYTPFVKKWSSFEPVTEEVAATLGREMNKGDELWNMKQKIGTAVTNATEAMGERAIKNAGEYDRIIGGTAVDAMGKYPIMGSSSTGVIKDFLQEKIIDKIPDVTIRGKTFTANEIVDFFKYSPSSALDVVDKKDEVMRAFREAGLKQTTSLKAADFATVQEALAPEARIPLRTAEGKAIINSSGDIETALYRDANGAVVKGMEGYKPTVFDSKASAEYLLNVSKDDKAQQKILDKVYQVTLKGKTGVVAYDRTIDSIKQAKLGDIVNKMSSAVGFGPLVETVGEEAIRTGAVNAEKVVDAAAEELVHTVNKYGLAMDIKPFERLLTVYPAYIALFKWAKVAANVASHVVSNIGNFFMGAMMGLPVWKKEFFSEVANAKKFLEGRLGAMGTQEMFLTESKEYLEMMIDHPGRFYKIVGVNASEIMDKLEHDAIILGLDPMKMGGSTDQKVAEVLRKLVEDVKSGLKAGKAETESEILKSGLDDLMRGVAEVDQSGIEKDLLQTNKPYSTPSQTARTMADDAGNIKVVDEPTSMYGTEIAPDPWLEKTQELAAEQAKQNPGHAWYKFKDFMLNGLPKRYERIDQTWKLGTTNYLVNVGLTDSELKVVSRGFNFTKDDISGSYTKLGETYHKLKPLAASEIALEVYMDYSAMPDFVKIARALPFAGSSFLSFPYAMAMKTGKTVLYNPAAFNKVSFMINEMNGVRSPQEKAALENQYNQYLKSPSVMRLAGMLNVDIKNLVPYYTMQAFSPSEKSYGSSPQEQFLKGLDKVPFLQDPLGAVFKDYVLQPWVLAGTQQVPQGQFGQPILPTHDINGNLITPSLGTRIAYMTRAAAETVVPGTASLLGPMGFALPNNVVDKIPSYGFRSSAYASQGKSSIGAQTKQDAVRKGLWSWVSKFGIPFYTLDTTKTQTKLPTNKK